MKKMMLLTVMLLLLSGLVFAQTQPYPGVTVYSIGPERWFLNGVEVSKGTNGAISGEILARANIEVEDDWVEYGKKIGLYLPRYYMGDWVPTWYRDVLMEQAEHYGINIYQGYIGGVKSRFGLPR
jgi:hypothetical protein